MNQGEAQDTMCLLRWLTGSGTGDGLPTLYEAREAGVRLAERAYGTKGAGLRHEVVRAFWPRLTDEQYAEYERSVADEPFPPMPGWRGAPTCGECKDSGAVAHPLEGGAVAVGHCSCKLGRRYLEEHIAAKQADEAAAGDYGEA